MAANDNMHPVRRVIAIAVLATLVRAWLAWRYFGFATGDDAEIVQESFRLAFGLDYVPWEIRSLTASAVFVAPLLRLASWCGMHDPASLALLARAPFVLFASVNIVLVFLVARRWFDDRTGVVASALYAVHWIALVYGSSTYPRVIAVTCVLSAVLLARRAFLTGMLLALAFAMRFSEAVFALPLLLLGSTNIAMLAAGFVAGVAIFVHPYSSLPEFARFTLLRRVSSSLDTSQPLWWYFTTLPQWLAPPLWPLLFAERVRKRALSFVLLPLLLLSFIHHKELRYLQVVIPFAMILAAGGALQWWDAGHRKIVVALLLIALPLQLGRVRSIERRSMPAVEAAQFLAARGVHRVALSQVWAYGGRVYLGNGIAVADLDVPPRIERVGDAAARVDCMAMYASEVTAEIRAVAVKEGLTSSTTFARDRGRTVEVLCR